MNKISSILAICFLLIGINVCYADYKLVMTRKDSPKDFDDFIIACGKEEREDLVSCLEGEKGKIRLKDIKKQIIWKYHSTFSYVFRNKEEIDYHKLVCWVASKNGISDQYIETYSTFQLEEKIAHITLMKIFDALSVDEKKRALNGLGVKPTKIEEIIDAGKETMLNSLFVFSPIQSGKRIYENTKAFFAAMCSNMRNPFWADTNVLTIFVTKTWAIKCKLLEENKI